MKHFLWQGAAIAAIALLSTSSPLLAQTPVSSEEKSQAWRSILDHSFPRLVVVLSFDQMRADLLTRSSRHFLPAYGSGGKYGGFRWLMEDGANMVDTHFQHVPLHTGPGHATIMTGAAPRYSGIIGNSWPTETGLTVNCVGDSDAQTIGAPDGPMRRESSSPKNLIAETVGDVLKMSNNRKSKVYGIAIKDRGAILPSGHNADGAVWFDSNHGLWVTSTWYTTGTLPTFALRANEGKIAERYVGKEWDYLLPEEVYDISMPEGVKGVGDARGLPATFPKKLGTAGAGANKDYFNHMIFTPYGNEMVFETAKLAVEHEDLGQDLYPDILTVSFSTTDLVGHSWGPHSREAQDTIIRADRQLSDFINYLDSAVMGGMDNVLVVLTGDHGAAPLPEWTQEMKMPSERILYEDVAAAAEDALAKAFPDKQTTGLIIFSDPHVVFRTAQFEERGIDIQQATDVIAERLRTVRGISAAYTRQQIQSGQLPNTRQAQFVTNGFNPERCGEIVVLSDQFFYNSRSKTGTTHGTGFNYDTHVPMVFAGAHIKPGIYTDRADVRDIAPTLSFLLGITAPASSEGRILGEIIK